MAAGTFFSEMQSYAEAAAAKTGIAAPVILAQLAHESTYGGSYSARTRNNFAGISNFTGKIPAWSKASGLDPRPKAEGGWYYKYDSIGDFFSDYVYVMNNSRYDHVRSAGSVEGQIKALATPSPVDGKTFAADRYGGDGSSLLAIVKKYNLATISGNVSRETPKAVKTTATTLSTDGDSGIFNLNPSGWMENVGTWVQSAGFIVIGLPFLILGLWFLFGRGGGTVVQLAKEVTEE